MRSVHLLLWVLAAPVLFLVVPFGMDYLYYYLPAAQYLAKFGAFPPRLLPSFLDAPFAYPPAEFLLLYLTGLAGPLQGICIRLLLVAKAGMLLYVMHGLSRLEAWRGFQGLFLLAPALPFVVFFHNTDLNLILAVGGLILFYFDERRRWLAVGLTAYALLSKYTFLPLYAMAVVYFGVRQRRKTGWLLVASIPLLPFLWKNQALYGNPFYPMLASIFEPLDGIEAAVLREWTVPAFDRWWMMRVVRGMAGALVLLGLALPWRKDRLLAGMVAAWVVLWAVAMNHANVGDSTRFLLPVTLLLVFLVARLEPSPHRVLALVAVQVLVVVIYGYDRQQSAFAVLLFVYLLSILRLSDARPVLVACFAILCLIRGYAKFSIDFQELGYVAFQKPISRLTALVDGGRTVLTDYIPLPLELRLRSGLIYEWSILGHDRFLEVAGRRSLEGVDYLFLEPRELKKPYFDAEPYELRIEEEIDGFVLARVVPKGRVEEAGRHGGQGLEPVLAPAPAKR